MKIQTKFNVNDKIYFLSKNSNIPLTGKVCHISISIQENDKPNIKYYIHLGNSNFEWADENQMFLTKDSLIQYLTKVIE